jgi:hypothetical protein
MFQLRTAPIPFDDPTAKMDVTQAFTHKGINASLTWLGEHASTQTVRCLQ